ncbi:MAG TPA: hypothetical protein DEH78_20255 [Solibacterales bacterium]|nr:hypothetical protein [Bryobacterales bacterium]
MSLSSNVQSRYSAQILVNLTNPQDSAPTTLDSTRLTNACTDVEAWFKVYANTVYDDANAIHVAACVPAVILMLQMYSAQTVDQTESLRDGIKGALTDAGKILARAKVISTTNSQLTPSDENPTGGEIRPDFDRSRFYDLVPDDYRRDVSEDGGVMP